MKKNKIKYNNIGIFKQMKKFIFLEIKKIGPHLLWLRLSNNSYKITKTKDISLQITSSSKI